jgi:fructosamine-3-kinase
MNTETAPHAGYEAPVVLSDATFTKRRFGAPHGFFDVEVAGLHWLAGAIAGGGVAVARPLEVREDRIVLQRLAEVPATDDAAADFGRRLAATHRSGAAWFGCPPGDWDGDGFIASLPLSHIRSGTDPDARSWGRFYARRRLHPFLRAAHDAGRIPEHTTQAIDALCARLEDGDEDLTGPADEPVSRLHGDLWAGNVLWTPDGVVLVDPSAHGGHRETDLAMLDLFGLPRLSLVLAAYQEAWPLADGWRDRIPLHQLYPLLVHAVLFGGGYGDQVDAAARHYR